GRGLRAVEQQSKKLDVLEGRAPVPPSTPAAVNAPTSAAKPKPAAPAAEHLQPLPPPADIRPAPTPPAPRAEPGAAATQGAPTQAQQKPAPAPPRPRSLSEILFGLH